MKSRANFRLTLERVAIAILIAASAPAYTQTTQVDEINAGIRARVAAQKGKPPEKIHLWDSGTVQLGAKEEDSEQVAADKKLRCQFTYYGYGDDKGKLLANEATRECYKNEDLKAHGHGDEVTHEAYELWKDHKLITKRAPVPVQSTQSHCTPGFLGSMNCRSY